MTRLLVTGAGGFVGGAVLRRLAAAGRAVDAVTSRAGRVDGGGVTWHQADLRDADEARGLVLRLRPSHVLHLAWVADPARFWTDPENEAWLAGTRALASACLEAGTARLVGAGSCAEYDWSQGVCREGETPLRPATPYGRAKVEAGRFVETVGRESGLSTAWGRIFHVYGPGEAASRLVPSVIRALLAGREAACTAGTQVRDFLWVDDLADAFLTALDRGLEGAFNVGSGRRVAVADVVRAAAAAAGRPELVRLGALPDRAGDPPLLVPDPGRLAELGWAPRTSLEAGMMQAVAWWKARA